MMIGVIIRTNEEVEEKKNCRGNKTKDRTEMGEGTEGVMNLRTGDQDGTDMVAEEEEIHLRRQTTKEITRVTRMKTKEGEEQIDNVVAKGQTNTMRKISTRMNLGGT